MKSGQLQREDKKGGEERNEDTIIGTNGEGKEERQRVFSKDGKWRVDSFFQYIPNT